METSVWLKTQSAHVQYLAELIGEWGGNLWLVDYFRDDEQSPFCSYLGMDWDKFEILICPLDLPGKNPVNSGHLIHEMGHMFACIERPNKSIEFNFFGWEYALAKFIGCYKEWADSNRDYGILTNGRNKDFGELDAEEKMEVLEEEVEKCKERGLITPSGFPIAIRTNHDKSSSPKIKENTGPS